MKQKRRTIIFIYIVQVAAAATLLLTASQAQAEPACEPSASMTPYDYPGVAVIPTSNNLILPTGKSVPASGQKIVLSGRVLDKNCKPVPQAVVELWQASPFGRWLLAGRDDLASPNPVFAGAGRTYTNLDGTFTFTTAFPAPSRYGAPNVNIRVKPQQMGEYKSALFFSDDVRNDQDKFYQKLSAKARSSTTIMMHQDEDGDLVGTLTIVLPGKAPWRVY